MREKIKTILTQAFQPEHLEVEDQSARHAGHVEVKKSGAAGATHFSVTIVSSKFEGKPRIERHRMVYDLVLKDVGRDVHALAIKALTPGEWRS